MTREHEPEVTLDVPWAPGHTVRGPASHVQRFVDQIQQQRIARTQWPKDNRQQMTALARLFPSMNRQHPHWEGEMVPGCDPWEPEELVRWLNTSGEPTSGSRHAALFLLSVWNDTDWAKFGLKVRNEPKTLRRRIGRFDFNDAFASWDEKHRAAALAWFLNPFWP
jgi:hypothetical protein